MTINGTPCGVRGRSVNFYDGTSKDGKFTRSEETLVRSIGFSVDWFAGTLTKMVQDSDTIADRVIASVLAGFVGPLQTAKRPVADSEVEALCNSLLDGTYVPPEGRTRTAAVVIKYRKFIDALASMVEGFNPETSTVRVNGSPVTFASLEPTDDASKETFELVFKTYLASKKYGQRLALAMEGGASDTGVEID